MKDLLEEEFENDPVRKEVAIAKLDNELYTESILNMHPETTYSTVEAGRIIGRPDSTIRNYFRTELIHYIEPEKFGKYYRLNYKSVFKLHMILLLIEKAGKSVADIAYYTGMQPLTSASEPKRFNRTGTVVKGPDNLPVDPDIYEKIDRLEKGLLMMNVRFHLKEEEDKLKSLKNQLEICNKEIENIDQKIEHVKLNKYVSSIEKKYYKMLDVSLRKTQGTSNKEQGFINSLLSIFKGNNNHNEINIDDVLNEAARKAEEEVSSLKNEQFENQIKELNSALEFKKGIKSQLENEIKKQEMNVKELRDKILMLQEQKEDIGEINFLTESKN
jgi:hypothetical protein